MKLEAVVYILMMLFLAFMLEHLPMPELISWFQPAWVMLIVTVMVLFAPSAFGLWLAIPLGLMLDTEHGTPLGLHIILVALHIYLLQLLYRRIYLFNVAQQSAVLFLMIMAEQIIHYWAVAVLYEEATPVMLFAPAITTAILWPWLYVVGYRSLKRLEM